MINLTVGWISFTTKIQASPQITENRRHIMDDLIWDEWDENTGEDNNLLLMDATAKPTSLTSEKNDTPSSIQFLMRTQEIELPDEDEDEVDTQGAGKVGIFGKIKEMLLDFWDFITGLFS